MPARGDRHRPPSTSSPRSSIRLSLCWAERTTKLKRALTDPRTIDGIGNAYSGIQHAGGGSRCRDDAKAGGRRNDGILPFDVMRVTLQEWIARLSADAADAFPEKVTAFGPRWPCTENTGCRVRAAVRRFAAFALPTTKRTIVRVARPEGEFRRSRAVAPRS